MICTVTVMSDTDTKPRGSARLRTLGEVSERMELDRHLKDPERYLRGRIRAGQFRARKVGRSWLMTEADIEAAIDSLANTEPIADTPAPAPAPSPVGQPSPASLRRRRVA